MYRDCFTFINYHQTIYVNKYKSYPCIGLEMPLVLQEVEENTGGKVVSPRYRLPIPLRKYSWYSFLLEAETTARP